MNTKSSHTGRKSQSGVMLLEALIGILIFSLGILALVGMQALAVRLSSDARDRAEASNLANQIVGQMWLNRTNLATNFVYPGGTAAALNTWVTQVQAKLPGAASNPPTITFAPSSLGASVGTETTVTLRWNNPSDSTVHQFILTAYIN